MNFCTEAVSLADEHTPNKKIVSCQINGWMETCAKQAPIPTQRPARYLCKLRIVPSPLGQANLSKLKDFRNSLLRYALNRSKQSKQPTPHTADSIGEVTISANNSKAANSPELPTVNRRQERSIRGVNVSEFCESLTQKIVSQTRQDERKKLSQIRLPAVIRKASRDLNRSQAIDPTIIQNKITQNQYCSSKDVIRKLSLAKN